jgi:uncharacterized protein
MNFSTILYVSLAIILIPGYAMADNKKIYSPGFDCDANNLKSVEKLICDDNELSQSDFRLNEIYSLAVSRVKNPSSIKNSQRDWVSRVRNRCKDTECLRRVYESREIYLGTLVVPTGDFEIQFEYFGEKYPIRAWRSNEAETLKEDLNKIFSFRKDIVGEVISCDSVWENHAGSINTGYGGICWAQIEGELNEYFMCSNEVTFNYELVIIRSEYLSVRFLNRYCYGG